MKKMNPFEDAQENYNNLKRTKNGLLYDLLGMEEENEEEMLNEMDEHQEESGDVDLCYKLPSGVCMAAGSEYCDFECPFN